jgi:hypothetical protein
MWSAVLAIYRLLENSSHGPEEIKRMTDAFEEALRILRLSDRLGPVSELVAARIVAIAKTGVRDPMVIAAQAVKTLGIPLTE